MHTSERGVVWRTVIMPDGDEAVAAVLEHRPRWSIDAIWQEETDFSIREIEAEWIAPWTDGALFAGNGGQGRGAREAVLILAAGRWRSCVPAKL